MSLKERITEDMKSAMRGAQKERLGTVRMILAAVKQREVDERVTLDDAQILAVIDKMVKQRKESIASFEAGGRADLVAKEAAEITLLQTYLPAQLSAAEIETRIDAALASTGATSIKDMGKVMNALKSELAGRADMGAVSARIKQKLA
ncbi:MAG TPA: GatB/YqeY domain-containing protein [Steroidobacteraceae bacterium]